MTIPASTKHLLFDNNNVSLDNIIMSKKKMKLHHAKSHAVKPKNTFQVYYHSITQQDFAVQSLLSLPRTGGNTLVCKLQQSRIEPRLELVNHGNNALIVHKKKKCVTFAPMATVVTIPSSKVDIEKRWYQKNEYRAFEDDRRNTVAAYRWAKHYARYLNPEQYTLIGLEKHLSRRQLYARKVLLLRHSYSILKQQHYYQEKLYYDDCAMKYEPESVQTVYW